MDKVKKAASLIDDTALRSIEMGPVVLEAGAIKRVGPYLKDRTWRKIVVVADKNTYMAAGPALMDTLSEANLDVHLTVIQPDGQGDVIADETAVVQLLLDLKAHHANSVLALGTGTLHDIARFAAYTTGIPFISVPTAPSVDGFNSKGAPLILRGEKKTIQAIGPDAIFADLDILAGAPASMVAAGFGDMIAKYTSLFDWKFGSIVRSEPYSPIVAELTRNALQQCVDGVEEIAARSPAGIRLLTGALIESGFAMLMFGQSHPASGAEHHLSHYWEMEFLRLGRKQILHGAKVGVACAEIAELYHRVVGNSLLSVPEEHHNTILQQLALIPKAETIRGLLRSVDGPSTPEELGVDSELLARSMKEAYQIRPNRYTLLRAYVDAGCE
ncbi:MAG: sn-glycerol-phosphate dehydrogenase [Cohnella sp.]|nr:sn-glycerol-phosphate dehydrogenase [Cohnella sp.]